MNIVMILKRETGALEPRAQENGGGNGKLARLRGWIEARTVTKPDLTLDDLVLELAHHRSITIHRTSVWRHLRGFGLTHKKDLRAVEQKRPDVALARRIWIGQRQPFMRNMLTRCIRPV